jgi:thiosulfate/3-mercaptopyruvate sulfurtransferase
MSKWVLSPEEAKELISQGATVFDTRNKLTCFLGHISGAININWQSFSQNPKYNRGKLIEDNKHLQEKFRQLGVCNAKPVVVVGNTSRGFGEEGRIVWMLRSLGHENVAFVDGGYNALLRLNIATTTGFKTTKSIGDFVINRTSRWDIQEDEIKISDTKNNLNNLKIIDTRSKAEYSGFIIFGEQRGGHIPDAGHLYFKDLMDKSGKLYPSEVITTKLSSLGISLDTPIVTYCTGGVRSAFVLCVLVNLGYFDVKNYAGSMWEWSAGDAEIYPLIKFS